MDAYATSVIFGNPSPSQPPPSAHKQPSSSSSSMTHPGDAFLLDGSSGSKRGASSPGSGLRAADELSSSSSSAMSPGFGSSPGMGRRYGAPLQSMLERQATAGPAGAGGLVSGLLARSPYRDSSSLSSSPHPAAASTSFFGSATTASAGGSGWGADSASASATGFNDGQQGVLGDADAAWHRWVVVSGFPAGFTGRGLDPKAFALAPGGGGRAAAGLGAGTMAGDEKEITVQVLLRLQQYGDVTDHAPGRGNWLFVQYATPYDAQRATTDKAALLTLSGGGSGVMLTVTRLTADLARSLDFHWTSPAGAGGGGGSMSSSSSSGGGRYDGVDYGSGCGRQRPDDGDGLRRRAAGGGLAGAPLDVAGGRAQALTARDDPSLMAQYLRPVKRAKSICERVLDWFYA